MLSVAAAQRSREVWWAPGEIEAAISNVTAGAIVAYLLYRSVRRVAPRRFGVRVALLHLTAAPAVAAAFLVLTIACESLFTGSVVETRSGRPMRVIELLQLGVILYVTVVLIAYSAERRARAAQAEAEAARAQLAALRAQLHPHFLFNALHTVVQLIPMDPARAVDAAELVAALLRRTVEEDRDEVPLDEEWTFVSRYLEVERIRFGDRLRIRTEADPELLDEPVPSFALQTLVENAIRHGAAHRVAPTEIVVIAAGTDAHLTLSVRNTGDGPPPQPPKSGTATGLSRLRERLALLYGDAARLTCGAREDGGYEATLMVPRGRRES